jgi:hypothetical protein
MNHNTQPRYYQTLFWWMFAIILLLSLSSSYIQSEAMTALYREQIKGIDDLCPKKDTPLKYFKIVKYEKSRKDLILQCIYKDGHQNSEITANLVKEAWKQVRVNKLNEKGGFYWPIYL